MLKDVQSAPLEAVSSPVSLFDQLRARNLTEIENCGGLFPLTRYADAAPNYNQVIARGDLFPTPDAAGTGRRYGTCLIAIEEEEEPPPTYEEALTYARLSAKFHLAPYGDDKIGCDVNITNPTNGGSIPITVPDATQKKREQEDVEADIESDEESDDPNKAFLERGTTTSSTHSCVESTTESDDDDEEDDDAGIPVDSKDWNNNIAKDDPINSNGPRIDFNHAGFEGNVGGQPTYFNLRNNRSTEHQLTPFPKRKVPRSKVESSQVFI